MTDKALLVQDKKELETKGELTKTAPVFTPAVDIFENKEALILVADMPGVSKDGVEIHIEDNQLGIRGQIAAENLGSPLIEEYPTGDYMRTFTLSNLIDQSRIEAGMKNGVLRVVLPKAEAAKPRKITIN
jgi:HSP20 family protein